MILSNKRMKKALIRLRGCAGWSTLLLFANLRRQVFSRRGPFNMIFLLSKHIKANHHLSVCETPSNGVSRRTDSGRRLCDGLFNNHVTVYLFRITILSARAAGNLRWTALRTGSCLQNQACSLPVKQMATLQ